MARPIVALLSDFGTRDHYAGVMKGVILGICPDVTLVDVRLPDMTGFEILDNLKAEAPVVIMITAHGDVPMAVNALQSGAENFLTKPVDLALLQLAVERGLEKASLRRLNQFMFH